LNENRFRRLSRGFAEDVGMAADEFFTDRGGDLLDVETPRHRGDLGMEEWLQVEVAEFIDQLVAIPATDRRGHLVGFLEEMTDEAFVGLLGIPRTTAGRAKSIHNLNEALKF
jgi:hypothetical protein